MTGAVTAFAAGFVALFAQLIGATRLWMLVGVALGGVLLFGIYPLFA